MHYRMVDGQWHHFLDHDYNQDTRLDWVFPHQENRTPDEAHYSFTDHFLWRNGSKKELEKCSAQYSDRMWQFDPTQWEKAGKGLPQKHFDYWDREDISKFISAYYDKPTEVLALSKGCNQSSGYPYYVFYFRDVPKKKSTRGKRK